MEDVTQSSEGAQLGLYVKIVYGRPGLNGIFNDDGSARMLEESYIKKLDIISPSIVALLDQVCGEDRPCPVTTVFTEYVDITQLVYGNKTWKSERNMN